MKRLLDKLIKKLENNRKMFIIMAVFLMVLIVLVLPSFATLIPTASVEIESEKLSYQSASPGSWKITKSAKWIAKGKARITLNASSIIKPNNDYTDVIMVLDTSSSMAEASYHNDQVIVKLDKMQSDAKNLINKMIPEGNKIALITFNDTSTIVSNFTDDSTKLVDSINNLTAHGNTNYYQALQSVETILTNYIHQDDRDCVVLFITDGLPNIDTPNEIPQYQNLKANYPYLTINAIQYEMGSSLFEILKKISDNQFIANVSNLDQLLYKAAVNPVLYDNFEITDYINNEYFTPSEITVSAGEGKIEGNQVTWNLGKIISGFSVEATIDVDLKEELIGKDGLYPTNERLEVSSTIRDTTEQVTSTKTPILANTYQIIYEANAPDGCTVTNLPSPKKMFVMDQVSITDNIPSCTGYQFKGWKVVTEGVEKINADHFIMPESDVTVKATWAKITIKKSMDGEVSKVQVLYQMMADNSVPDNIRSEFVTSSSGINFWNISSDTNGKGIYQAVKHEGKDTPIYYYRGDVNNNLIYGGFCWKIVRTTPTKGVKIIYNGVPSAEGSCNNTGAASTIGESTFNSKANSIAYNGYMYGDIYELVQKTLGRYTNIITGQESTNYLYSTTVKYNEETAKYELGEDRVNKVWKDTYTENQYLYSCFSDTGATCSTVGYVIQNDSDSAITYISLEEGETADEVYNKEIMYGNDVDYNETTGMYQIKSENAIISKVGLWSTDYKKVADGRHYTCFNKDGTCKDIAYITYIANPNERRQGSIYYTIFSNGITVETAIDKMTIGSLHTTDSAIKKKIDDWYEANLLTYDDKLEDTIYCNDTTVETYGSWLKDGNANTDYALYFKAKKDLDITAIRMSCRHKNDAYTVKDTVNGNGDLKYPVGLLTADEAEYAGVRWAENTSCYLYTGTAWWLSTQFSANGSTTGGFNFGPTGSLSYNNVANSAGIRPVVSLVPGTKALDGNGSAEDPFVVS